MGDLVGCPMVMDEVEGGYIMMGYRMLPETCFKTLECFFFHLIGAHAILPVPGYSC